jgi:LPXTG-motif cell wall-anchored protein
MIQNALELGTYSFGDSASMNITLSVDKNIEITKEKSEADIGWHFFAVREEDSGSPKTGETARNLMILLTAILLGGSGVLLTIKKRQTKCE